MALLETPAGTVAYDERGEGSTILLLSAGAHDGSDFERLRALLPDRFRTVSIDWPGHGGSPAAAGPVTAASFAALAEEALARLAPDGAVLVGNSVGGFAAARIAIRRPALVRGLVVVDGGGFAGRPPYLRAFCALMGRPWFLRRIYPAFSRLYMRSRTDADRRAREGAMRTVAGEPGLSAVSQIWRSFGSPEHDLRRDAPKIAAPTLMVWGRRDPVIPLRFGKRAAALVPGARLAIFDTGHVPFTTDPEGFAAELVPFADAAFAGVPADASA
jgi:pimeloyl-ACP methyl ester carboxylesterase